MGNLTLFATAFMVAFSGALMPGPLLTVAINHSLRRGVMAGPLISLGHGLMEILVVGALLVGLGRVLEHGLVAAAVALGGGLVLAWMGYGMIREGWLGELTLDLTGGKEQREGRGAFAAGVVATAATLTGCCGGRPLGPTLSPWPGREGPWAWFPSFPATSWPTSSGIPWWPFSSLPAGGSSPTSSTGA